MTKRLRVVVVDDSPLCRELLREILEAEGDIEVVGEAGDGASAIREIAQHEPDLATIDILMPGRDGLWTVEQIMAQRPLPILVVTGQPAGQGSDLVFQAVSRGALDLAEKPAVTDERAAAALRAKVRRLARLPVVRHVRGHQLPTNALPSEGLPSFDRPLAMPGLPFDRAPAPARMDASSTPLPRRSPGEAPEAHAVRARSVVGIVASAGGPAAIATVLSQLPRDFPVAIALVQHLPTGFTEPFVRFLRGVTPLRVVVVTGSAPVLSGTVFVPTDDRHLVAASRSSLEAQASPLVGGHRPSATVLFQSLARVFGPDAAGVVLTGIGDDGAVGLAELKGRGALTLAQDKATSAVYGMPEAAARLGAVGKTLPLGAIAGALLRAFVPLGNAADGTQTGGAAGHWPGDRGRGGS